MSSSCSDDDTAVIFCCVKEQGAMTNCLLKLRSCGNRHGTNELIIMAMNIKNCCAGSNVDGFFNLLQYNTEIYIVVYTHYETKNYQQQPEVTMFVLC